VRVAVAGAGVAGLTAAIALARRGLAVDVFERTPEIREIGAGIQLSPNATSVLERLDILDGLSGAVVEPEAVAIHDGRNGALLAAIPLGRTARQRYGSPYLLVHRADLQAALLAAANGQAGITMHLDAAVGALQGNASDIRFSAGGGAHAADILVAADGLNSDIRTGFFGHPGPESLARIAWRATLPREAVPPGMPERSTGLWLAPGAHLVHYPVRDGRDINVVVIAGGEAGPRPPARPFGQVARRLLEAVPEWTPWPLFALDASRRWVRERVVLLGDAAHAMAPSAAQGGAQAIEDAWVIAATLAARPDDAASALLGYERGRRPRVERVVREARRNLALYDVGGLPAAIRNIALGAMSDETLLSRLDWLFGWKPQ
jgi:salicylate hydroxylase